MDGWTEEQDNPKQMKGNHLENDVTVPDNPFLNKTLYKPQTKLRHAKEEVTMMTYNGCQGEATNKVEAQVEEVKENTKDRNRGEDNTNPEILRL